jgi:NodT family efflux transporter outer membrane factor (OMF) lipoprotein
MLKKISFAVCLLSLNACMVGPDYKEAKTNVVQHWPKKDASIVEKKPKNPAWWKLFQDKNLTALILQGYHNNLSLQKAGVHVLQSRAQLAQIVGNLYPQQQNMNGNYQYYRIGGNYLQDVLPPTFTAASLGFLATWEIDFWGKYRRAVLSQDSAFLSSLAAYDHSLVTLTSDIANHYIALRTNETLIQVVRENIAIQRMSLQLTESRYKAGEVSLLDVAEAKTMLAETEAMLPSYIIALQTSKDALALLLGLTPAEIDPLIKKKTGIPQAPEHLLVDIPREAIAQRPDVEQARLNAIAQSEAIGATQAQLYPAFSLSGSFSFAANTINGASLSQMFNSSNQNIIAGPLVNWPLLNYGQITNQVRAQDAIFQQALLDYMNVVLEAQKEVQDNITAYIESKKTKRYLEKAVKSAIQATKLTLIQYREGETDYTPVLYAEQQQLRVQTELVDAQSEVPKALVGLYRALGGGWQIRQHHDVVPQSIKNDMAQRTNWGDLLKEENHQAPTTDKQTFEELYLPNW